MISSAFPHWQVSEIVILAGMDWEVLGYYKIGIMGMDGYRRFVDRPTTTLLGSDICWVLSGVM
jgi:hypothetical protein